MYEIYQEMCLKKQPFKAIEGLLVSAVVLQDLEAIKEVLITQFNNFPDRGLYVNLRDPLLANVSRLHCDLWRPMRQAFSQSITGAKCKLMFPILQSIGQQFVEVLGKELDNADGVLEIRDLFARYSIDIIGNLAFGNDCNSLKDPQTRFRSEGGKAMRKLMKPFMDQVFRKYTKIMNFCNYKYFDEDTINRFTNLIRESMEYRKKNDINRQDFLDMMMEMRNHKDKEITPELLTGQMFVFYTTSFENISVTLSKIFYELSKNPEIQEKARKEVKEIMDGHEKQEISYESIKEIKYLKQILLETLRIHPMVHCIPRICSHRTTIHSSSGSLEIPADTFVLAPLYGIHHNPDIYPEPHLFRPERFEDQEIVQRDPLSYLAYGDGPRGCPAKGFSDMLLIFSMALLLSQFRFGVCERTPAKLIYDRSRCFHVSLEGDIYMKVEKL